MVEAELPLDLCRGGVDLSFLAGVITHPTPNRRSGARVRAFAVRPELRAHPCRATQSRAWSCVPSACVAASVLVQLEGQGGHPGSDGGPPCYLDRAPGATRGIPATTCRGPDLVGNEVERVIEGRDGHHHPDRL